MDPRRNANIGMMMIVPVVGLLLFTAQAASAYHVDDRYGVLISVFPEKYDFDYGETVSITGEVHALRNGHPLLLRVFNAKNTACSFQQLGLDAEMKFKANPIRLDGALCGVDGEYRITAHYGKGKALTKFNVAAIDDGTSGGRAEVTNARAVSDILRADNRYPVDLNWATNAVFVRNNTNETVTFYLMFAEFDADEHPKELSYKEVTLDGFRRTYIVAPFVPQIIDGKPNGYLHVFAWTSLDIPAPLHPGLYIPY